jgi:adenine-specific DNA-methyltransferase
MYSTTPIDVDRLIVSAFLKINKVKVSNNTFIKSLIITDDNIEEYINLNNFISVIKTEVSKFDLEALIEMFEFVISPSDRIINGAIYTPKNIREYITNQAFYTSKVNITEIKIADISCGCGGFLLSAAKKLRKKTNLSYKTIFKNNIYGLDIQNYSICVSLV